METAAGVSYGADTSAKAPSPVLIRCADDFVVHCHTRQEALEVKARLAEWLTPRGLAFNDDKTQVVSLSEGYDFLGFDVRRHRGKLLIKPSKTAVRRIRRRLRDELRSLPRSNASAVLKRLKTDHPGLGRLLPDTGIRRGLRQAGLLPVATHMQVGQDQPLDQAGQLGVRPVLRQVQHGQAGPVGVRRPHQRRLPPPLRLDQHRPPPDRQARGVPRRELADYWAWRRRKAPLPINLTAMRLYRAQDGRCTICKTTLLAASHRPDTPRDWEHWLATTRKTIDVVWRTATSDAAEPRLIHPTATTTASHQGLLEPDARKRARPVLRGARRREASGLPADAGGDPWDRPRAGALRSGADGDPEFNDSASWTRAGQVGGAAECAWPERVSEADEHGVRSAIEAEGVG